MRGDSVPALQRALAGMHKSTVRSTVEALEQSAAVLLSLLQPEAKLVALVQHTEVTCCITRGRV